MIIGLTGKMGAGKDTVADYLVDRYQFRKVGFSDQIYDGVCGLFGIDRSIALAWKDPQYNITVQVNSIQSTGPGLASFIRLEHIELTWRQFIQQYGTDMARKNWGEDFWVDLFEKKYLMNDNQNLVVRDVRFNNEAAMLGKNGATIWEVLRPGYEGDDHESEAGIHEGHIDGELTNDGSLTELYEMLDWWMEELRV